MKMTESYEEIEQRMKAWFHQEKTDRPMVKIVGVEGEQRWPKIPEDCQKLHSDPAFRLELMEIEELKAINWVPGVAEDDGGHEKWYPLYDKVREAGKSLWISMDQGDVDRFIEQSRKLVRRYGSTGLYLLYRDLPRKDAEKLYREAERNFR